MNFFIGRDQKKELSQNLPISKEARRLQIQLIKEYNSNSFNLHLAISNTMTLNQMKNESLKNIFTHSKEIDSSEKYQKPKSKFWIFNRAQSESLMPHDMVYEYDDVSD